MLDPQTPVGRLVLEHAAAAFVLRRYRIDFCCRGELSVAEACAEQGVPVERLSRDLEQHLAEARDPARVDPRELSSRALLELIVERHHGYLREALPFVIELAEIVSNVHGTKDPRLVEVHATLRELLPSLIRHLDHEEHVLFPRLRSSRRHAKRVIRELDEMKAEHRELGQTLARLRELTGGFHVPEGSCSTHRALLAELEAIESDVFRHVHLENYVLAPRYATS